MNLHDKVPVVILHVLEADIPKDTGIVNEDIYPAEVLDGGLNDLVAVFYRIVVGDCVTAGILDLCDDYVCSLFIWLALFPAFQERKKHLLRGALAFKRTAKVVDHDIGTS